MSAVHFEDYCLNGRDSLKSSMSDYFSAKNLKGSAIFAFLRKEAFVLIL